MRSQSILEEVSAYLRYRLDLMEMKGILSMAQEYETCISYLSLEIYRSRAYLDSGTGVLNLHKLPVARDIS